MVALRALTPLDPAFLTVALTSPVPVRVPPPSPFHGHHLWASYSPTWQVALLGGPWVTPRHGRGTRARLPRLQRAGPRRIVLPPGKGIAFKLLSLEIGSLYWFWLNIFCLHPTSFSWVYAPCQKNKKNRYTKVNEPLFLGFWGARRKFTRVYIRELT